MNSVLAPSLEHMIQTTTNTILPKISNSVSIARCAARAAGIWRLERGAPSIPIGLSTAGVMSAID
jgi:hypothetical protein